ncbi:YggT family protein [Candidatus Microgenomates bacterium]|nr:YggT family protein [Candidatus Microgenomates bacterium]
MKPGEAVAWLTQVVVSVVESLLGVRFLLRLFNADQTNRFVTWLYDNTRAAIDPFLDWFPTVRLGDGFVVEFATLFAMVAYMFLAFLVLVAVGTWGNRAQSAVPKRRFSITLRQR